MRVALLFTTLTLGLTACAPEGDGADTPGPIPGYELAEAAEGDPGKVVLELDAEGLSQARLAADIRLIDVRSKAEFDEGHIDGAELIPLDTLDPAAFDLSDDRKIVFYCRSGRRSTTAAQKLAQHTGKPAVHLKGGIVAWNEAGFETVIPD
ncbi:MAG: rhodanese-like domain-containing protein [Pseudomonadota bacterium]